MSKRLTMLLLAGTVLVAILGLPALAQARAAYTVSKPKLSATPVSGVPFTASGLISPKSTARSRAVVKIRLYMLTDGHWGVMDTYRAKLGRNPGGPGTRYSRAAHHPHGGQARASGRSTTAAASSSASRS